MGLTETKVIAKFYLSVHFAIRLQHIAPCLMPDQTLG